MEIRLLLVMSILALITAKLEINIEGKYGWAEKLPTWRIKNNLTDLLLDGKPFTGYHLWLFSLVLFLLHVPFLVYIPWGLRTVLKSWVVFVCLWS